MLSSRRLMYKFVMVISLSLYVISISQPWLIQYTGSPHWSSSISKFWSFQVVARAFRRGELLNSYVLYFQDFWFFSEFSHLYYGWFLVFVLQILGIITGEYRGTFRTVGDKEHSEIIRLYVEEGLSVDRIAERLGRSSRTPHEHVRQHNKAVERSGFCPKCRRVLGKFETVKVRRGNRM